MQEFKQDCTLNLMTSYKGKNRPISWGITIVYGETASIDLCGKYGSDTLEEVEITVLHYGLGLMSNLRQEKVEIRANFDLEKFFHAKVKKKKSIKPLQPEIELLKCEIMSIWESFRLKRIGELHSDDVQKIQSLFSN
ncbi:MAG: hypothetical protein M9962_06210 [Oligoflexia bacterium]|nr:hypothetical protein [Oligoflexia bacterium]